MNKGPQPFVFDESGDAKRFAPATERNRDAITAVLADVLPKSGTVLEVASGTGEHIVHFSTVFSDLLWQPSDYDEAGLASIAAWTSESGRTNILRPVRIDASAATWPITEASAVLCINMVHISPWEAALGLMSGAGRILPAGGMLYLYGPYRETLVPTALSNEIFDESLKSRNPEWGLRSVDDMIFAAEAHGLYLEHRIEMPANNLSLVFRKN